MSTFVLIVFVTVPSHGRHLARSRLPKSPDFELPRANSQICRPQIRRKPGKLGWNCWISGCLDGCGPIHLNSTYIHLLTQKGSNRWKIRCKDQVCVYTHVMWIHVLSCARMCEIVTAYMSHWMVQYVYISSGRVLHVLSPHSFEMLETAVNGFNAFRTLARVTSQSYAPFLETLSRAAGTSLPNMMIDVKNKLMPCDTTEIRNYLETLLN